MALGVIFIALLMLIISRKIEVDRILKNENFPIDILKKYCKTENENNFNNYNIAKKAGFNL